MSRFHRRIGALIIVVTSSACAGQLKEATGKATEQILLDVRTAKAQVEKCKAGEAATCTDMMSRLQSAEQTAMNLQSMAK